MKRLALVAALACIGVTSAQAAPAPPPFPAHVYAPYFETWTTDSLTTTAEQSGAHYFTLAFLETLSKSSCTLAWDGSRTDPVTSNHYVSDIAPLRMMGGDVIPSFGGWSADQAGTEIADSCKDVNAIAHAYEDVITRYGVTRLDMDVEGRSLNRADGIDRRNKALAIVQAWAQQQGLPFQVSYTWDGSSFLDRSVTPTKVLVAWIKLAEQCGGFFFGQVKVHDPEIGSLSNGRESALNPRQSPRQSFRDHEHTGDGRDEKLKEDGESSEVAIFSGGDERERAIRYNSACPPLAIA